MSGETPDPRGTPDGSGSARYSNTSSPKKNGHRHVLLWLCLLTSNFNLLYQKRRIAPTIGKKIEGDVTRVRRPDRVRLCVRVGSQGRCCVARQIDQPETAGGVLVKRV